MYSSSVTEKGDGIRVEQMRKIRGGDEQGAQIVNDN